MRYTAGEANFDFESIDFADVKAGDTIAHLYVDSDNGAVKLWVGETDNYSEIERTWYGPYRRFFEGNDYYPQPMVELSRNSSDNNDVLIVAEWHAGEDGHSIFRVTGEHPLV